MNPKIAAYPAEGVPVLKYSIVPRPDVPAAVAAGVGIAGLGVDEIAEAVR
jgi:hypothetical protein